MGRIAPAFGHRLPMSRTAGPMLLALGTAALSPLPMPALAQSEVSAPALPSSVAVREAIEQRARSDLRDFYAARANRPLWLQTDGAIAPAAHALLRQLETAGLDGLKPGKLKARSVAKAIERAARERTPAALARAEIELSKRYAAYVKALRKAPRGAMIYESQALAPVVPTTSAALNAAASAPSLKDYVAVMGWMHPLYAPLREALASGRYDGEHERQIRANLSRIRALPADPGPRHVLIDAAGARLWMFEKGKPVGTMRVVVGKADNQTPLMAGFIRFAIVNPYWNVPEDLVRKRIAPNVLSKGIGYLKSGGYQALSDWSENPRVLDPVSIDWQAVADGARVAPRVRQLPGKANFMGKVKFMFPNDLGIYLHDTPDRRLLLDEVRQHSSGCVRLENAATLGRWLLNRPLPTRVRSPETRIELPEVVPLYITYLTATPENGGIAFRDDVYSLDGRQGKVGEQPHLAQSD